ncbi:hypothetical protein RZN32_31845, partial [Klebsiella pneumoniae]|nr:hypothetical protein [Klebsiella pneumoniae]
VNPFQPQPEAPFNAHYIRTHDRIPKQLDDISLHQAIVAFYSDFTLMTTALRPHGLSYISPSLQCASMSGALDPAIQQEIVDRDLYATAVLSGNRNFDGRTHPYA